MRREPGMAEMTTDADIARELGSLHEQLLAGKQERTTIGKEATAASSAEPETAKKNLDHPELVERLSELADEALDLFADVEKNFAVHPTRNIVGTLLLGILIGYLFGRR